MWFDDTYLPESETFRERFSPSELEGMAAFNQYFDERTNRLPDPSSGVTQWLRDENWQQIVHKAAELLAAFANGKSNQA